MRFANGNHRDPLITLGLTENSPVPATLNRRQLHRLATIGALDPDPREALNRLQEMSVDPNDPQRSHVYASLLTDIGPHTQAKTLGVCLLRYCPLCLCEDEFPYYRRTWCVDLGVVCDRHAVRLVPNCARCGRAWTPLMNGRLSSIGMCPECRADLSETPTETVPAHVHARMAAMQARMLGLRAEDHITMGKKHVLSGAAYAAFVADLLHLIRRSGLHALFNLDDWDLRMHDNPEATRADRATQRYQEVALLTWCLEAPSARLPELAWIARRPGPQPKTASAANRVVREDLRFKWLMDALVHASPAEITAIITGWYPALRAGKRSRNDDKLSLTGSVPATPEVMPPELRLTAAQWAPLAPVFDAYRTNLGPQAHSRQVMFEGVLYYLSSGVSRNAFPDGYPPSPAILGALTTWRTNGTLSSALTRLYEEMVLIGGVDLSQHVRAERVTPDPWRVIADAYLAPRLIEEMRWVNPPLHRKLVNVYVDGVRHGRGSG